MAVDRERRAATVTRLIALRTAGTLTTEHVRLAARGLKVTERTIWRWLDEQSRTPPQQARTGQPGCRAYALTPIDREAFARQLTPAERAAWIRGEEGRRQASVYLTRPRSLRNHTWEADHKQLPIVVLPPRGPALKPWLTTVVDDGTRALLGWTLAVTPHTGTVLTAFHMALVYDVERGPFGAVPTLVRVDRGLEFAAGAVYDVLAAVCRPAPAALPQGLPQGQGGADPPQHRSDPAARAARLHRRPPRRRGQVVRADRRPLRRPRQRSGRQRPTQQVKPIRIEHFAARFAIWARWYNTERPHRMLSGRTPLQAWEADLGGLVEQGVAAGEHDQVDVGFADGTGERLPPVHTDADTLDDSLPTQLQQGGHSLLDCLLPVVGGHVRVRCRSRRGRGGQGCPPASGAPRRRRSPTPAGGPRARRNPGRHGRRPLRGPATCPPWWRA